MMNSFLHADMTLRSIFAAYISYDS